MSMIDTQNGYDLGYSYCKVCEDWSKVEHDHDDKPIGEMTAEEIVALLPVCPQCGQHGVMDGELCTRCRKAIEEYTRAVYHAKGDLFSSRHAWRDGECKWCGAKGSRISANAHEKCPG